MYIVDMDTFDNLVLLPSAHVLDYEALLCDAKAEGVINISAFLRTRLPSHWRDLYVSAVARPTNIVRFDCGNFEYFCDLYSELEVTGEVAYDQTVQNRVIAVLGTSTNVGRPRGARMTFWFWSAEEFIAANRDRGHFIAHSIGGGLDVKFSGKTATSTAAGHRKGKSFVRWKPIAMTAPAHSVSRGLFMLMAQAFHGGWSSGSER
jgi:hypothetical protein